MPCKRFVSIRLDPKPNKKIHFYVDCDVTKEFRQTLDTLETFTLQSKGGTPTAKGATVTVEILKWRPPGYDAPVALSLNSQWPYGGKYYEEDDMTGADPGRSYSNVEFVYNAGARTLSWNQDKDGGGLVGSIRIPEKRVCNIVLVPSKGAQGLLIVDEKDIAEEKIVKKSLKKRVK
jgi:hypothetical protein